GSETVRDGRAGQTRSRGTGWHEDQSQRVDHKAMSYERMKKREAELKAEVARMWAAAEAADCEEDKTFGKDKRGDELPDWAGDKEKRLGGVQAGAGGRAGARQR